MHIPSEIDLSSMFASRLRAEIEELRELSVRSRTDRAPVELDQQSVGRVSRVDSLQVQAMATAAEARRIQRIRTLEAAQQRLDEGEFGFCTECGEFIGLKRLEIDAAAIRCIACAS